MSPIRGDVLAFFECAITLHCRVYLLEERIADNRAFKRWNHVVSVEYGTSSARIVDDVSDNPKDQYVRA